MGTGNRIVQASLVLWLCLGTQLHMVLEHNVHGHHDAVVHSHDELRSQWCSSPNCAEAQFLPQHPHQHQIPHTHELGAVPVSLKIRMVPLVVVAVLPEISLESAYVADSGLVKTDSQSPPTLYLSSESVPRAPPRA